MVEVDARGLSCPEPIMLTAEALKNEKGPIKVLVSEPVQKENVEKYAKSQGKKPTSKEVGVVKTAASLHISLHISRIYLQKMLDIYRLSIYYIDNRYIDCRYKTLF